MKRTSFAEANCSIARSLEIVGEWWTLLIVRDAFFGVTRFEEFQQRLGIARNVLSARLDSLVDAGVMRRHVYDEGRDRSDYRLTEMGVALWPVIITLRQWGDEWLVGAGHEPAELLHTSCGAHTHARLTCDHCGEVLTAGAIHPVPGPGLDPSATRPTPYPG